MKTFIVLIIIATTTAPAYAFHRDYTVLFYSQYHSDIVFFTTTIRKPKPTFFKASIMALNKMVINEYKMTLKLKQICELFNHSENCQADAPEIFNTLLNQATEDITQ